MFRLSAFLIALSACVFGVTSDGKLDSIYSVNEANNVTQASLTCEGVVGRVTDCSECYSCDDPLIERQKAHNIMRLTLNDVNCASSEVICCLSQSLLRFRDKDQDYTTCGKYVPEGNPRALRPTLRSVLQGEYPWRAWIYRLNDVNCASSEVICCLSQSLLRFRDKDQDYTTCGKYVPEGNPRALRPTLRSVLQGEYPWRAWIYRTPDFSKPLCAATYVNQKARTLVTAASCVDGFRAHQLQVLFDKDPINHDPKDVIQLDIHEDYNKVTHENDIAVLSVSSVPDDAERACQSIQPVPHGTACVAVSSDDFFINQAIPLQHNCAEDNKPLHNSLMCAAAHRDDYTPELGAGLYCMDEQLDNNVYMLVGVYLYSALEGVAAINTNMTHHINWVNARANEHMQRQ
ncbi:uncharacterized protein LOC112045704 [Bicyclus anynana]|uniref:Uncharacterized protein LOC112045704 n=1 Tax=Bicyclus anynana TaxID=110368 RepID=A0A6J1MXV1_BICAN|nr:uncharacterized protein LOC112045704 [Bicyclus anynana]